MGKEEPYYKQAHLPIPTNEKFITQEDITKVYTPPEGKTASVLISEEMKKFVFDPKPMKEAMAQAQKSLNEMMNQLWKDYNAGGVYMGGYSNDSGPSMTRRHRNKFQKLYIHPITNGRDSLERIIISLNDLHSWSREQIADWLDTLDDQPIFYPDTCAEDCECELCFIPAPKSNHVTNPTAFTSYSGYGSGHYAAVSAYWYPEIQYSDVTVYDEINYGWHVTHTMPVEKTYSGKISFSQQTLFNLPDPAKQTLEAIVKYPSQSGIYGFYEDYAMEKYTLEFKGTSQYVAEQVNKVKELLSVQPHANLCPDCKKEQLGAIPAHYSGCKALAPKPADGK